MTHTAVPAVSLPPRYQLQTILKESPATAVYRVFDAADRRDETIKILRQELTHTQDLLQFKAEFSSLAALDHPAIIKVYDFGLLENRFPYFTMEYFAGRKITEFFNGQNWEELYHVILQLAAGLHHIHHAGIIHLDVKPSNLLVDEKGRVKLMDFGVATESRQFFDRRIRGTLHYMAPEVLRQDHVDSRADLYGLGMTLYETVTGALPTYGRPPIEIMRFHLDEEIRKPSAINPNIPEKLERIILKLLEKDSRHRYQSAKALLHDVAGAAGVRVSTEEILVGRGELLAAALIGREREIDELGRLIAEARDGKGGGVIVTGPEGMGKSRIVREATLRAQLDGARVFCGRCPVNRKSIYAPFFEIFQQMVIAMNPDADPGVEVRRILRPMSATSGEAKPARGQKFRLYNRIVQSIQDFYGFLNVVGDTRSPLILVVEDLQWADPSTAELFTFLVGDARHSGLLVIGTLTPDRTSDSASIDSAPISAVDWDQRAKEAGIRFLDVGPLTEDLVEEYVKALLGESSLPRELTRWIFWESSGSPLHIRRVIDYLIAHSCLRATSDGWYVDMQKTQSLRIPGGAAAIWSEKIDSIDPSSREILQIAAVLGEYFDLDTLTHVAKQSPEETYRIARDLVSKGLFEESADGGSFWFPQMRLRDNVYASILVRARAEIHLRAGEVLEGKLKDGAAELFGQVAYHFARGSDPARGINYSIRAGEQASSALAHEQAAEFYRIALELMDLTGEEERKSEIRELLGDSYYRGGNLRGAMQVYQFLLKSIQAKSNDDDSLLQSAGIMKKIGKVLAKRREFDAARSYFENAMDIYRRRGTAESVAEMLNRTAWIHNDHGDFEEAVRAASQAAMLLADSPLAPSHGYIKNTLGVVAATRGQWREARALFADALEIAGKVGSDQLQKTTLTNLGQVMLRLGEWDEALAHFRTSLDQAEREGDLWELVSAYNNVAVIELHRGNFHAAATLFEKSVRIDEKLGSPDAEALALKNLGEAVEMIGRWTEARTLYERGIAVEGIEDNRTSRIAVYVPYARLAAKMGDIPKALQFAIRAYEAAERARDESLLAEASLVLAQIEKERENFADATRYLTEAIALFERTGHTHGTARAYAFAGDLCFRQQKHEEAIRNAKRAEEIARSFGDRFTLALADWVSGKAIYVLGEREEGEARLASAHAAFDELDTPYEIGRLLFETGLLKEESDEASQTIRRAIKIFERLDAMADLERARGALFRIKPAGKSSEVVGLYEIVKIINSTLNLEEVLNRVIDVVLRRLRAERGMIYLIDPITGALRTRVVRNMKEDAESRRSPQAIIRDVIRSGQSIISADARTDERFIDSETVISENIVSTLCVPLVIRERIAGAIYIDHRETRHLFSQRDLNFLEAFADQAAIAIDNARLYEQLEEAKIRLSLENETLRKEVLVDKHLDSVVGHSEAVSKIQFTLKKAAAGQSTVLLRGESGTGKGLIARIIHNVGPRRNGPFIKFNCAALPETLAESELFGHEKGAFTGADRRKLGRFELANGGTIFLDEIGKVSLAMQAKLLRVVEEKEFERVGGTQTIKSDVKIIAATNLDLERAIDEGTFREDLFYRLNIVPILIPPLRERKEDIPLLVEHFIRKICRDLGIDMKNLEPGILELFAAHDWPGNVRELEAVLHRAIVMSSGNVLTRADFFGLLNDPHGTIPDAPLQAMPHDVLNPMIRRIPITEKVYDDVMSRVDRQLILQALDESGNKIRETARRLGLARNTLKAKLVKYSIETSGGE